MPFQTTDTLPDNPAVKIFLTGLMIIQPDEDGKTCEIFVNRAALDHVFTVEVRARQNNGPDLVLMRHVGPLSFVVAEPLRFGLLIQASDAHGLKAYNGPPLPGGEETLDLAIDLKKDPFNHKETLIVNPEGGQPSIFLNDGIFYTAQKTSPKFDLQLDKGSTKVGELPQLASLIGVNVYLKDGESLLLHWFEMGVPNTLEITKASEFKEYEIYIVNDPLYIDEDSGEVHDEFKEYYKILSPVPTQNQLSLQVTKKSNESGDKGTFKNPCMSVILPHK